MPFYRRTVSSKYGGMTTRKLRESGNLTDEVMIPTDRVKPHPIEDPPLVGIFEEVDSGWMAGVADVYKYGKGGALLTMNTASTEDDGLTAEEVWFNHKAVAAAASCEVVSGADGAPQLVASGDIDEDDFLSMFSVAQPAVADAQASSAPKVKNPTIAEAKAKAKVKKPTKPTIENRGSGAGGGGTSPSLKQVAARRVRFFDSLEVTLAETLAFSRRLASEPIKNIKASSVEVLLKK